MSIDDIAQLYKTLSDNTRLKILKLLEDGELCVCEIIAALDMVQPKVSFHLKVLKSAGIIKDRKVGRWIHYSLNFSNIFKNFILLSTIQNIDSSEIDKCKQRLNAFVQKRDNNENNQNPQCK